MDYNIEELKLNIERLGGIATSKQLQEAGYTRMMIYDSLMKGLITKESHGSYRWTEQETDPFLILQRRSERLVFSHLSSLYLQNICAEKPSTLDITVAQGTNISRVKRDFTNTRIHYCKKDIWDMGRINIITPGGHEVSVYDIERSICDMIHDKKRMDEQLFIQTIRTFFKSDMDADKLMNYADLLRVRKDVEVYMQIL